GRVRGDEGFAAVGPELGDRLVLQRDRDVAVEVVVVEAVLAFGVAAGGPPRFRRGVRLDRCDRDDRVLDGGFGGGGRMVDGGDGLDGHRVRVERAHGVGAGPGAQHRTGLAGRVGLQGDGRADVPRGRDLSVQGAEQVAAGAGGAELRPPWRRGPVEVADAGVVEPANEEHRVSGLHGAGDGDGEVPGGDMRLGAGAECDGHSVPLSRAGQRTLGAWNSWTSCGRGWTRTRSALTRSTMSRPPPGTWRGSAGRS